MSAGGHQGYVTPRPEDLPQVRGFELLADVKGSMGQGATHSVQHAHVVDHLAAQKLDTADFTKDVGFLFERLLGERPPLGAPVPEREWLRFRLAGSGADEVMLDLLRRHGAEEVEHRAAACDMYQHGGGSGAPRYARRAAGMVVRAPVMPYVRVRGTAYPMRHDPQSPDRPRYWLSEQKRATGKGMLPPWRELGGAMPQYFRRSYHPSQEGSLSRAVECLRRSPTARAAA